VLGDELVEPLEGPRARERVPAAREGARVVTVLLGQRTVGAGQPLSLGGDPLVDVGQALHPARAHAGLQVGLDRARGLPRAPRERASQARLVDGLALEQSLDRGARIVVGLVRHPPQG
jgi:hypothetical protein